jgi:hypothetical protein
VLAELIGNQRLRPVQGLEDDAMQNVEAALGAQAYEQLG